MSFVPPTPMKPRWGFSRNAIRRHGRYAEDAIPIPPSVNPPTPPTPPPASPSNDHSVLSPKDLSRFSAGTPANFKSKIFSSTPYPPNRVVVRKYAATRRNSQFPLLIPTELTLSIVRESPPTAAEELTCGDHVGGKEDSVSSTRSAEELAAITERRSVAYATSVTAAGTIASAKGIPKSAELTMGACTSKKSSPGSAKKSEKTLQPSKPEKFPKPAPVEVDDANDEEDPAQLPKFKLKRDSIAVTKVRMLKTQIHQENTIGEEEEDDEGDEHDDSGRDNDHVHFDNHVSKQSIPNDSGVSLNSCPDNDSESLCQGNQSNQDYSSIKFDGKLECDSTSEISLASNVTIRSLRRERIVEEQDRDVDFKTLRQRARQLFENQTDLETRSLPRLSSH